MRDGSNRLTNFHDILPRRASQSGEYRDDALTLLALMESGAVLPPEAKLLPLSGAADDNRRIATRGLSPRLVLQPQQ